MRRARLAVLIVVAAAVVAIVGLRSPEATAERAAKPAEASKLAALLGIVDGRLTRVDAQTLEPVPGKAVPLGGGGCASSQGGTACWNIPAWAASPDGARVAVASGIERTLRIVEVSSLRVAADLRLGLDGGSIGALAWVAPQRVVGIQQTFGERQRVVAFDLGRKRVVARRPLHGRVTQLERTARELVLLVAPAGTIGAARIVVVDAPGAIRAVRLDRIAVGSRLLGGTTHRVDMRSPGLALDPSGRRVLVVAQSLAAEVDLRSLAVSYHSLDRPSSLLGRLWRWLEPVAGAKQVGGYHRQAAWLGSDLLAVAGTDTSDGRSKPAGLRLADTHSWHSRTLDPGATTFELAGDVLLATGGRWDPAQERSIGVGVTAHEPDGDRRFQVLEGRQAWLALVFDGHAYVGVAGMAQEPLRIVELASGRIVGSRERPLPWLLVGGAAGGFGG